MSAWLRCPHIKIGTKTGYEGWLGMWGMTEPESEGALSRGGRALCPMSVLEELGLGDEARRLDHGMDLPQWRWRAHSCHRTW